MLIPCIVQHQLMLITHFMKHYVEFFPFIRKEKRSLGMKCQPEKSTVSFGGYLGKKWVLLTT